MFVTTFIDYDVFVKKTCISFERTWIKRSYCLFFHAHVYCMRKGNSIIALNSVDQIRYDMTNRSQILCVVQDFILRETIRVALFSCTEVRYFSFDVFITCSCYFKLLLPIEIHVKGTCNLSFFKQMTPFHCFSYPNIDL